jgi:Ribosomal Proteins L2, RNA binding domain/Ribosomal Proteins L2, C-terminal domain
MPIKQYNPTSPGRRFVTTLDFSELTKKAPERKLTEPLRRSGGRNNKGRITIWFRGGGHKRRYRVVDFRRDKRNVPAKVTAFEYDPNRSARLALLHYADGDKRYILAPEGLKLGQTVVAGESADILPGNALPLKLIPAGTMIHNLELRLGKGAQLVRSAGQAALGRGAPGARRVRGDRGPGRQHRPQERLARQGGPQALARQEAAQPGRLDEPDRPPARRRRGPHFRRPPPGDPVGQADQGRQDAQ